MRLLIRRMVTAFMQSLGEKGGLHQVVSEMISVCRFQAKEKKNSKLYSVCKRQSTQCRQGDEGSHL
jgi:hypothetical protein